MTDETLPAVAGDALTVTLDQFERSARVLLRDEQDKALPDNALLAVLCDAVRLGREYAHLLGDRPGGLLAGDDDAYPEVTGQMILDAGLNVFAFQLILKDLARFKDDHARLTFGYQGARWLIEVDRRP
jgi:hypothetical protein